MKASRLRRAFGVAVLLVAFGGVLGAWLFWPTPLLPVPALDSLQATVEEGRYLATASNCVSCHTAGNGQAYAGGTAFRTPFGTLYSSNITMDEQTGIGRWSFADFYRSMKQGLRPDGTHLYPAFPYTAYARLTDRDIAALYLYTRTLDPVPAPPRENELRFPFSLRALLGPWKKLFHRTQTFAPDPSQSEQWNRGAYLVEGPGHCGACHTPRNLLAAEREDLALTGGVYVDAVAPRKYRDWAAVNLTPHTTGLGAWSAQDIVSYLQAGENPRAIVHGPMNEVVMNSTRYLGEADLQAIAAYLKSIPPKAQDSGHVASEAQLASGEIGYTVHCGSCHLPTGLGDLGLGVMLAGNAIVQAPDPSSMINVLLYGPHLPPPPFVSDRTRMKSFGRRLSDKDIADIASYVRTSFGNQAGAVSAAQVERQR